MEGAAMRVPFCDLAKVNAELRPQLDDAYLRVMARGQYILGPEVEAFEQEWADYCQRDYCVGVGNALDGLTLMLRAYGIGPGDEVIVPANTYIATWLAVSAVGASPVPCDPDPVSMNLHNIGHAITDRTKAVLAVHLYGRPADVGYLRGWTSVRKIPLLIDAAQAHGIKGADLGDCAAFSFYPTKNLGALGDGGAVVTNDQAIEDRVRLMRNYGSMEKNVHGSIGFNTRLDELQAAFLRAKLPYLDEFNARRRRNATVCCGEAHGVVHQFVVRVPDRPSFRKELSEAGIETAVHYPTPPHMQGAYYHEGFGPGSFPVAELLAREVVSLPVGPELRSDQVALISRYTHEAGAFA